jgi:hypothetical protein
MLVSGRRWKPSGDVIEAKGKNKMLGKLHHAASHMRWGQGVVEFNVWLKNNSVDMYEVAELAIVGRQGNPWIDPTDLISGRCSWLPAVYPG